MMELDDGALVEVSRDATETRLSSNQATSQQRQRNFRWLGDVMGFQEWPNHKAHIV